MGLKILFILMFLCFLTNYCDADKDIEELFKDYLYINTTLQVQRDYYKFHSSKKWTDAQQICEFEESSLWYPKNYAEADAVLSLFKKTQNFEWVYIGISDIAVEGSYQTIDGIPIADVYHIWNTNQPDNAYDGEDCVHINTNITLNDINCASEYPFICKKTKLSVQEYDKHNNISNLDENIDMKSLSADYIYASATHDYYKFHSHSKWTDAQQICESEDSSFWYPKTRAEANAVLSLFSQTQDFEWVYIGISDLAVEGDFKTIDGTSVADVYNNWKQNQPDNSNDAEDCVHINTNITLNDINCNNPYPFICKKTKTHLTQDHKKQCDKSSVGTQLVISYEYIEATQASYKFHLKPETWSDAKRICESEGAKFFYPENHDEMREVLSFCKQKGPFCCMFIGISDLVVEGIFETIDGALLSDVYHDWQPGEPNNLNCTENCIAVNDKGQLNDDSCSRKYPFVCKKAVSALEWNHKCNMSNLDYTYNEEEGKCYKLHKTAMSWTDAYRACRSEQSYLAVINSKRERDHLRSLARQSSDKVTEVLRKETIHLGFHNRLDEGWITVKGTTLVDSGYAYWDVDQPNGSITEEMEKCGSMSYAGRLHDVACDKKSLFICEHDLKRHL